MLSIMGENILNEIYNWSIPLHLPFTFPFQTADPEKKLAQLSSWQTDAVSREAGEAQHHSGTAKSLGGVPEKY